MKTLFRQILFTVFFIALLIGCDQDSGKGFTWVESKEWKNMGPISFTLPEFPGQEFMLVFPEWFTSDRVNSVTNFNWDLNPYSAVGAWDDGPYTAAITITLKKSEVQVELHWEYEFKNGSDTTVNSLSAFNCLNLNWAPLFKDLTMERTWVRDAKGREVSLKDIAKTQGEDRRTMQFYPVKGGIDLNQFGLIARWQVNSPAQLTGNRVKVFSKDGKWQLETIVDGPVAYFFNNWEEDHGCVHAAPLFHTIAPGESGVAKGRIIFTR